MQLLYQIDVDGPLVMVVVVVVVDSVDSLELKITYKVKVNEQGIITWARFFYSLRKYQVGKIVTKDF